jgi:hypothetical protein
MKFIKNKSAFCWKTDELTTAHYLAISPATLDDEFKLGIKHFSMYSCL